MVNVPQGANLYIGGHEDEAVLIQTPMPLRAADWSWMIREEQAVFSLNACLSSGEVNISVPAGLRLVVESRAGNVDLKGMRGTVVVKLGCGNIKMADFSGVVDIRTGSGDLNLEDCSAIGHARTDCGQVWCRNISHDLVVDAGLNGAAVLTETSQNPGQMICRGMDLRLGQGVTGHYSEISAEMGSVTVDGVPSPLTVHLTAGRLYVGPVAARVDLTVRDGQGLLEMDADASRNVDVGLKLIGAQMSIVDKDEALGSIMLALSESKPRQVFLALPFPRIADLPDSPTVQLGGSSGRSRLMVNMSDSVLAIGVPGDWLCNRRQE